jgi:hypothetical protein
MSCVQICLTNEPILLRPTRHNGVISHLPELNDIDNLHCLLHVQVQPLYVHKKNTPLISLVLQTVTQLHNLCVRYSILALGWRHCEWWACQDHLRLQELWCLSGAQWSSAYTRERFCIYGTQFFTVTMKSMWILQFISYVDQSCWQATASCLLAGN